MSEYTLVEAGVRESFGKGAARRLRASGQIPAVIYGHGSDPRHLSLPAHLMGLVTRRTNAVINLSIDGATELALVRDVQTDPVRQEIEHIDLAVIKKGERVEVEVPVHVEGESAPGTLHTLETAVVNLEVEAISIPESVTVDLAGRGEGEHLSASDVVVPAGATLLDDPELLIVSINIPAPEEEESAESEEVAESTEAAAE